MLAIVLAEAFMEKFGGDSLDEMQRNYAAYQSTYNAAAPDMPAYHSADDTESIADAA